MARKNSDNVEATQISQQDSNEVFDRNNLNEKPVTADVWDLDYLVYSRSRCGGTLRIAREKQGLTLSDVASKLKISQKQITALEADHFAALPEATIVKGFIRNYAKFLKLDAEPLLDAYNVLVPSKEPLAFTLKPSSNMKVNDYKKPKTGRYIALILLLIVVVASWLFYQHYIEKPSPTAPIASAEKLELLPQQALPAAERVANLPAPEIALPPAVSNDASGTTQSVESVPLNNAPSTVAPSATANAQLMLDPTTTAIAPEADISLMRLEIGASQETWVNIKDASGKEIYSKIVFAGSRQALEAKPPLDVVFGNAAGANLTVNGKPVDLAPHTRVNIARLKLE